MCRCTGGDTGILGSVSRERTGPSGGCYRTRMGWGGEAQEERHPRESRGESSERGRGEDFSPERVPETRDGVGKGRETGRKLYGVVRDRKEVVIIRQGRWVRGTDGGSSV